MAGKVKSFSIMVILLTIIFGFTSSSCQKRADPYAPLTLPPSYILDNGTIVQGWPPKAYPHLDSAISQLVSAYENGGDTAATAFAQSHGLKLLDGMVMVVIEVNPGHMSAVVEAVNNAGAKTVTTYEDIMQAFVPLKQIKSLAGNPDIRIIEQQAGISTN